LLDAAQRRSRPPRWGALPVPLPVRGYQPPAAGSRRYRHWITSGWGRGVRAARRRDARRTGRRGARVYGRPDLAYLDDVVSEECALAADLTVLRGAALVVADVATVAGRDHAARSARSA
jgi:hypothetical protein